VKSLVVVAHPDDEIIWCGGLLMQHPDWRWTVCCLSRGDDADRAPKFRAVCSGLGLTGLISDMDDSNPPKPIDTRIEIGERIMSLVPDDRWDMCATHGSNGEYGHPRHRQVHDEVQRLVSEKLLRCGELWTFAYECDSAGGPCRPAQWAETFVNLSEQQLADKKRIVSDSYGYGRDSFEVRACISPECFRKAPLSADRNKQEQHS